MSIWNFLVKKYSEMFKKCSCKKCHVKYNLTEINKNTCAVLVSLMLTVDTCLTISSTSRRPGKQLTQLLSEVDAAFATYHIIIIIAIIIITIIIAIIRNNITIKI